MLTSRFYDAILLAGQLHGQQTRKGSGEPYVSHLLAVASLVLDYGGNEDEAIAALLHDTVEDQGGAEARALIARRFGENVAAIVDGCSDTDQKPKPPWRQRKETYIAHLAGAPAAVVLVSAADKLHNARATLQLYRQAGETAWGVFKGGRDGTLWYYRAVTDALAAEAQRHTHAHPARIAALVHELDCAVQALEAAARAGAADYPMTTS